MCINQMELDQRITTINQYKSIKKDAEAHLKPLEQDVKDWMEENNHTKFIGYGYSISYKEEARETVVREKVLEFLNNPAIKAVIEQENIDTSVLFKTTITKPLRIN